jgi:L-malate glycosyltransferase
MKYNNAERPVKILVISHTYITRVGREKWRELVRNHDVQLKIIVPTVWKDYLFSISFDEHRDDELDMTAIPVCFSGKEAAHFYQSWNLLLNDFKPDILHVEEGTDAFSYFQALMYRRIYAPHAKTLFFTWMNFEKQLSFPFSFFEKYNLRHSDAAICGNADARDILRIKGFEKPVYVLPLLGLDPDLFQKRAEDGLKEQLGLEGLVIGFIGRFVEEKGVLDLIDTVSRLSIQCSLLMIGGGRLDQAMQERAKEKGISDQFRIVRSVPHKDIPAYINTMDVLVLPSYTVPHWKEQFGQVLVQAMASEVPVLGSTHAEIPRVIGDAGLTFEERNTNDLYEKLTALVTSGELRSQYAKKGRLRVLENYTHTKIAERTYSIYKDLLRGL